MKDNTFELNIDIIYQEINNVDILGDFNSGDYNVDEDENNRGTSLFAQPKKDTNPFISLKNKELVNGRESIINLIWTCFDDNNPPDAASSQTAKRKNLSLPSAIQYKVTEFQGKKTIELIEVLYVLDKGYSRYNFKNNVLDSMWNFFDTGAEKMYDINEPLYITFHSNGKKKEVWYFNPNANDFKSACATIKMSSDEPVVITYHDNGDIHELDYTGYVFSKKVHPSVNAFPFGSRFSFYKPSYICYKKDSLGNGMEVIKKYFFQQAEKDENDIYSALESFGVDTSSTDKISETLKENPMFEDLIRNMLGVAILKESDLDLFNTL